MALVALIVELEVRGEGLHQRTGPLSWRRGTGADSLRPVGACTSAAQQYLLECSTASCSFTTLRTGQQYSVRRDHLAR